MISPTGALRSVIGAMQGDAQQAVPPVQHEARLDAISTLERHEDAFGKKGVNREDMERMVNDPKTPPDLKQALETVLSDPGLMDLLDRAAAKGGSSDGKFKAADIKAQ